jgi:hypothetical protein
MRPSAGWRSALTAKFSGLIAYSNAGESAAAEPFRAPGVACSGARGVTMRLVRLHTLREREAGRGEQRADGKGPSAGDAQRARRRERPAGTGRGRTTVVTAPGPGHLGPRHWWSEPGTTARRPFWNCACPTRRSPRCCGLSPPAVPQGFRSSAARPGRVGPCDQAVAAP